VETDTEMSAYAVNHVVAANPEMWRFEHVRLVESLHASARRPMVEVRRVLDADGKVIAVWGDRAPAPTLERSAPLLDAGEPVGRVVVTRTVRPVVIRALLLTLVLVPLAMLAFAIVRRAALRAIREGEAALRTSEARFRALIEKSSDMIMVFDEEKRIRFWSPSATDVLGWTAEEMVGRNLWETGLVHPEDVPALVAAMESAGQDPRQVPRVITRTRHKDGGWRLVEGTGRNLLHDPAVRRPGGERPRRDGAPPPRGAVPESQKLESIGRLAGGVAHDFNNLLTVILSCSESLRQGWRAGTLPDRDDVEQIHQAGERARTSPGSSWPSPGASSSPPSPWT